MRLLLLGLPWLAIPLHAADWPSWRHDASHSGASPAPLPKTQPDVQTQANPNAD